MATISEKQVAAVYDVTTSRRRESASVLSDELSSKHGMKKASATYYVLALQAMLSGKTYKKTINEHSTRYFLEKIAADYGKKSLSDAIESVKNHVKYYQDSGLKKTPSKSRDLPSIRKTADDFTLILGGMSNSWAEVQREYNESVRKYILGSSKELMDAALRGEKIPKKAVVSISVFIRSPAVAAQTLVRASGNCERCNNPAPFIGKKDKQPFLEVHHVKQLANGGSDTLDNTQAICPNCHRELHYGV